MGRPKKNPEEGTTFSAPAGEGTATTATQTVPSPETPPAVTEQKVEVPKSVLEQVLERMTSLETALKERDEKIDMLTTVADKARLAKYELEHQGALIRQARVGVWNGGLVIGWKMEKDHVAYHGDRLVVDQQARVYYTDADGKMAEEVVEYRDWAQRMRSEIGDIISTSNDTRGTFYTIKLPDGRETTVDIRFLNAF